MPNMFLLGVYPAHQPLIRLQGISQLWFSWILGIIVVSEGVVVVSHTATSQEDSVGDVEASIVLWISLEAQARGWCVSCLGPHCRQAKHVTHETSRCYSNLAINLKLLDDAKNITKLYDIQMVGLILIQTVSWCFQIDIVSKFSKSNGKPNFMYQYVSICKKRFLPQKVFFGIHSQHHSQHHGLRIPFGLVLQLSRLLKLLALHHSLSDGHRILWGDKKKSFFQPVNFLPTKCILPMWWRDLVVFLNKWRMICWISGDFRTLGPHVGFKWSWPPESLQCGHRHEKCHRAPDIGEVSLKKILLTCRETMESIGNLTWGHRSLPLW